MVDTSIVDLKGDPMTRIQLELSRDGEDRTENDATPVVGSFRREGGPSTSFVGWVELLSLLEQSIDPPATPDRPNI